MKKIFLSILIIQALLPVSVNALAIPNTNIMASSNFIQACGKYGVAKNTPVCTDVNRQYSQTGKNQNAIIRIIRDVINIVSYIVGIAAVIIIVISGLRMILSSGDAQTAKEARGGIIGAVVGLLVVALAQVFVVFVLNRIS